MFDIMPTKEKDVRLNSPDVKKALGKVVSVTAQNSKAIKVMLDGSGKTEKLTLPEKGRLMQTIIPLKKGEKLLPEMEKLAAQIKAVEATGDRANIILTAPILDKKDNPRHGGTPNNGTDYKYYVVGDRELTKHGLSRANVQRSAAAIREDARNSFRKVRKSQQIALLP